MRASTTLILWPKLLPFYDRLFSGSGAAPCFDIKLRNPVQGTYVDIHPGMTAQSAKQELESVWEWAAEDRLKVRPCLKERYRR